SPARMPCASSSGVPRLRRPAVLPPKAPGAARRPACACPFWSCPYLSRLGRPGTSPAQNEPRPESALRRWHHAVHVYDVKPQTGNPEHEPGQGGLIGQLSAKGGRARAHVDLAVVEFSADRGAGLAREGDLVHVWTHLGSRLEVADPACCQPARRCGLRHHPSEGDLFTVTPSRWSAAANRAAPCQTEGGSVSMLAGLGAATAGGM